MPEVQQMMPLLVICDLRKIEGEIGRDERLQEVVQQAVRFLDGNVLEYGKPLAVAVPERGKVLFWSAGPQNPTRIDGQTPLQIVDVLRRPEKYYVCQQCKDYGPLQCVGCREEGVAPGRERICSACAYFVGESLDAYCPRHKPACNCSRQCQQTADFICSFCSSRRRFTRDGKPVRDYYYNHHVLRHHPKNAEINLCVSCYNRSFNPCPLCQRSGQRGSARLQCTFKTLQKSDGCGEARCWAHTYQWKVWGPQSAGITLCERHQVVITTASAPDLLLTLLTARPPRPYYTGFHTDISRVRRMLNRNRQRPFTFVELEQALRQLGQMSSDWPQPARDRYEKLLASCTQIRQEVARALPGLTEQVRRYYRQINPNLERQIRGVEIAGKFQEKDTRKSRFEVVVSIQADSPGLYIGKSGSVVRPFEAQFHVWLKFMYSDGRVVRPF